VKSRRHGCGSSINFFGACAGARSTGGSHPVPRAWRPAIQLRHPAEARDGQKWCAIKVLLYLGRAMAHTGPAARPGCDKFKTCCLIPLNPVNDWRRGNRDYHARNAQRAYRETLLASITRAVALLQKARRGPRLHLALRSPGDQFCAGAENRSAGSSPPLWSV
jgi:hypothetical protein